MTVTNTGARLLLRARVPVIAVLAVLAYWSPWLNGSSGADALTWLALPSLVARSSAIGIATATVLVTIFAGVLLGVGALLRVVASAGRQRVGNGAQGAAVRWRRIADVGGFLFALGAATLMPVSGALVFLASLVIVLGVAALAEKRAGVTGSSAYVNAGAHPRVWIQALLQEIFFVGFAACFAVLGHLYNAHLLLRALLICFGVWLVLKAGMPGGRLPGQNVTGAE